MRWLLTRRCFRFVVVILFWIQYILVHVTECSVMQQWFYVKLYIILNLLMSLVGRINVSAMEPPSVGELELEHTELDSGGSWKPISCIARHRVAVIVPFRDREEHLRAFLGLIHPMLQRQLLHYTIFVAEQVHWFIIPVFSSSVRQTLQYYFSTTWIWTFLVLLPNDIISNYSLVLSFHFCS